MPMPAPLRLAPLLLILGVSCAPVNAPSQTRDVVSLVPQASVALADLGFENRLAGVLADDPVCPPGCVRLGRLGSLDGESIIALAPKVMVSMAGGSMPADKAATDLALAHPIQRVLLREPRTTDEALAQIQALGDALGAGNQAKTLTANIRAQLQTVLQQSRAQSNGHTPRVLMLESISPQPGALGPGMLHGSLLEAIGAQNALPAGSHDWVPLDGELIIKLNPDVVVLLNPDAARAQPLQAELEAALGHLPITAAKNHQLKVATDAQIMIPSSNLPRLARLLADAVFPPKAHHDQPANPSP